MIGFANYQNLVSRNVYPSVTGDNHRFWLIVYDQRFLSQPTGDHMGSTLAHDRHSLIRFSIRGSPCFGLRLSTSDLINAFMIQIDDIAGGIVRHAGDAAMRSDVDWDTIRAGLLALADHPGGHTALKTALERINDPDVKEVLAIWFRQAAEEQQKAERKTKRPAETGLGPLQTTLMGLSGAAVIAGLAGTIALPVAAFVFATLAVGAGAAWFGRMKLLERADQYEDRAKTLNSLAKLCHND